MESLYRPYLRKRNVKLHLVANLKQQKNHLSRVSKRVLQPFLRFFHVTKTKNSAFICPDDSKFKAFNQFACNSNRTRIVATPHLKLNSQQDTNCCIKPQNI